MTKIVNSVNGREEIKYNRIVGINHDDIWVLDGTFRYANGMHGATGYRMYLVKPDEIQEYRGTNPEEVFDEPWREAVSSGRTTDSLAVWSAKAWAEERNDFDALWPGDWDHSFVETFEDAIYDLHHRQMSNSDFKGFDKFMEWWADQLGVEVEGLKDNYFQAVGCSKEEEERWEELGVFRSSGCGRMFSADAPDPEIVIDPEAIELVRKAEEGNKG